MGIQPTSPYRVESYGARLLIVEEVYALRSRELLKRRAVVDVLLVQIVGRKEVAEERTTKPRAAVVKVQLRL